MPTLALLQTPCASALLTGPSLYAFALGFQSRFYYRAGAARVDREVGPRAL